MECMCAQTKPQSILSSKTVFVGMESETMLTPSAKIPSTGSSEVLISDTVSRKTASPTPYQLSYSGPHVLIQPREAWELSKTLSSEARERGKKCQRAYTLIYVLWFAWCFLFVGLLHRLE